MENPPFDTISGSEKPNDESEPRNENVENPSDVSMRVEGESSYDAKADASNQTTLQREEESRAVSEHEQAQDHHERNEPHDRPDQDHGGRPNEPHDRPDQDHGGRPNEPHDRSAGEYDGDHNEVRDDNGTRTDRPDPNGYGERDNHRYETTGQHDIEHRGDHEYHQGDGDSREQGYRGEYENEHHEYHGVRGEEDLNVANRGEGYEQPVNRNDFDHGGHHSDHEEGRHSEDDRNAEGAHRSPSRDSRGDRNDHNDPNILTTHNIDVKPSLPAEGMQRLSAPVHTEHIDQRSNDNLSIVLDRVPPSKHISCVRKLLSEHDIPLTDAKVLKMGGMFLQFAEISGRDRAHELLRELYKGEDKVIIQCGPKRRKTEYDRRKAGTPKWVLPYYRRGVESLYLTPSSSRRIIRLLEVLQFCKEKNLEVVDPWFSRYGTSRVCIHLGFELRSEADRARMLLITEFFKGEEKPEELISPKGPKRKELRSRTAAFSTLKVDHPDIIAILNLLLEDGEKFDEKPEPPPSTHSDYDSKPEVSSAREPEEVWQTNTGTVMLVWKSSIARDEAHGIVKASFPLLEGAPTEENGLSVDFVSEPSNPEEPFHPELAHSELYSFAHTRELLLSNGIEVQPQSMQVEAGYILRFKSIEDKEKARGILQHLYQACQEVEINDFVKYRWMFLALKFLDKRLNLLLKTDKESKSSEPANDDRTGTKTGDGDRTRERRTEISALPKINVSEDVQENIFDSLFFIAEKMQLNSSGYQDRYLCHPHILYSPQRLAG